MNNEDYVDTTTLTEDEKKLLVLERSKISISNNVLTTNIWMDKGAHKSDPRFYRERESNYMPKPFSVFSNCLHTIRKLQREECMKGKQNTKVFYNKERIEENDDDIARDDPYIFAVLCGLRSMSDETEQTVSRARSIKVGERRQDNNNDNDKSEICRQSKRKRTAKWGLLSPRTNENTKNTLQRKNSNIVRIVAMIDKDEMNMHQQLLKRMKTVWSENTHLDSESISIIKETEVKNGAIPFCKSPYRKFDLVDIVRRLYGISAKSVPPRFAAVILRYKFPSAAVSIFSTGTVVCTGPRTEAVALYSIMQTIAFMREKGFYRARALSGSIVPRNVVATFDHDFEIDLDKLSERYADICSYNKDAFPGATVRPPKIHPAAQLVFESGKIVTMGGRSAQDLMRALSATFNLYYSVRKT